MEQKKSICTILFIPVRAEAAHKSEMVTQLLFGEMFRVLESKNEWHRIKCVHDNYEGWVDLLTVPEGQEKTSQNHAIVLSHTAFATSNSRKLLLPMGSLLPGWQNGRFTLGEEVFELQGEVLAPQQKLTIEEVLHHSLQLLETPYLWGGRSVYGIDCSGLMQLLFRLTDVSLPRDASQQVKTGREVEFADALPGDAAFFQNEKGKITHVGIVLEGNKILHASYKVRIDELTETGIYRNDLQKTTHNLFCIKRLIN